MVIYFKNFCLIVPDYNTLKRIFIKVSGLNPLKSLNYKISTRKPIHFFINLLILLRTGSYNLNGMKRYSRILHETTFDFVLSRINLFIKFSFLVPKLILN